MRQVPRASALIGASVAAVALLTAGAASAQIANNGINGNPYYSSHTYQYGLNLPQVPVPNGSDEIRAADGTTCRSNSASNGTYLDVGMLGSQGVDGQFDQGTVYGRFVIPLGDTPRRIDCTSLYQLELSRLQHELQLVRMGLNGASGPVAEAAPSAAPASAPATKVGAVRAGRTWAEDGWSNEGRNTAAAPVAKAAPVETRAVPQDADESRPNATARRRASVARAPSADAGMMITALQPEPAGDEESEPIKLAAAIGDWTTIVIKE